MTEHAANHNSELETVDKSDQEQTVCKNCHTSLSGPFCHQCGQPSKSIIRFFGTLIRELLEDIISLDSRAARTLVALLFRPGFLTKEYVAGRRFRYVPPLRLFLLTSLFCIFVIWVINKTSDSSPLVTGPDGQTAITENLTTEDKSEVLKELGINSPENIKNLSEAEKEAARKQLEQVNRAFRIMGTEEIPMPAQLQTQPETKATEDSASPQSIKAEQLKSEVEQVQKQVNDQSETPPDGEAPEAPEALITKDQNGVSISGDDVSFKLSFLSEEDNQQLEDRMKENLKKINQDPKDFVGDLLELIPKSMLLLVPLFAVLMKLCYLFAKRYYIEHLIHAFHGHAFLFLSILIIIGLDYSSSSFKSSENGFAQFLGGVFNLAETLMFIWIPIYFLISLRVVYQQHWVLTIAKWFLTGFLYIMLFSTAAATILILSILYN